MDTKVVWDAAKNQANIRKHGIDFNTAQLIFDGPIYSEEDYRYDYGEVRMRTFGMLPNAIIICVIHVDLDEYGMYTIRIISARFAKKHEEKEYYENI